MTKADADRMREAGVLRARKRDGCHAELPYPTKPLDLRSREQALDHTAPRPIRTPRGRALGSRGSRIRLERSRRRPNGARPNPSSAAACRTSSGSPRGDGTTANSTAATGVRPDAARSARGLRRVAVRGRRPRPTPAAPRARLHELLRGPDLALKRSADARSPGPRGDRARARDLRTKRPVERQPPPHSLARAVFMATGSDPPARNAAPARAQRRAWSRCRRTGRRPTPPARWSAG